MFQQIYYLTSNLEDYDSNSCNKKGIRTFYSWVGFHPSLPPCNFYYYNVLIIAPKASLLDYLRICYSAWKKMEKTTDWVNVNWAQRRECIWIAFSRVPVARRGWISAMYKFTNIFLPTPIKRQTPFSTFSSWDGSISSQFPFTTTTHTPSRTTFRIFPTSQYSSSITNKNSTPCRKPSFCLS